MQSSKGFETRFDICDVSAEEAEAVIAAVETREWDVAPDLSHLREIVEEEEESE